MKPAQTRLRIYNRFVDDTKFMDKSEWLQLWAMVKGYADTRDEMRAALGKEGNNILTLDPANRPKTETQRRMDVINGAYIEPRAPIPSEPIPMPKHYQAPPHKKGLDAFDCDYIKYKEGEPQPLLFTREMMKANGVTDDLMHATGWMPINNED